MKSTNGSWLRLSPELQKSKEYKIHHRDEIKIGLQCTFKAKIKLDDKKDYKEVINTPSQIFHENNRCDVCYMDEKNALLLPCKHNCVCIGCAKDVISCPICRGNVKEFIKIYKT